MKVAYYMPFKPPGHPNPSGDLVFGTELLHHLQRQGNLCHLASTLRCRWIYLNPLKFIWLFVERRRVLRALIKQKPEVWFTYHSYYKAPDLLGPWCAKRLNIPYVIFQGIYSTKRRRKLLTWPGFHFNRQALLAADMVFTNKRRDQQNLARLLPEERIRFVPPGIHTHDFTRSEAQRRSCRQQWNIKKETVILATAMFRPGVKTQGLKMVIRSCSELVNNGANLKLIIAGDGASREQLHILGRELLGDRILFLGRIPRVQLKNIYSGADIFAFPGINESLGMVYLEAQSCGLPVVAFKDWGGGEAVLHRQTGLLSPAAEPERFTQHIGLLINDENLRKELGYHAQLHIRQHHELHDGYAELDGTLRRIVNNCSKAG